MPTKNNTFFYLQMKILAVDGVEPLLSVKTNRELLNNFKG